jgi:hypothetical protein
MPFELRPYPNETLRPEGDYLQRAWQQRIYPIAHRMGVPIHLHAAYRQWMMRPDRRTIRGDAI